MCKTGFSLFPRYYLNQSKGGCDMKRKVAVLFVCLCCLLMFAGAAVAADITNPILKKLVEKGILTREEAISIMQDMEREAAEKDKKVEQKIERKVTEAVPAENKDIEKVVKELKGFKFGGLWYISYQNGENGKGLGEDYNRFTIKRGYINVSKEFTPWFSARITPDVNQMTDDGNFDGSWTV